MKSRLRLALPFAAMLVLLAPDAAAQGAPQGSGASAATSDAPATAPATAPPAPPRRASWTSDRRAFAVGDIITVLLDESTLASATKDQRGSDRQERGMDLGVEMPATAAKPLPGISAGVGTGKRASSDQTGVARRNMRFVSEMSVRVVQVDANGRLQVEGKKLVDLDRNRQEFAFTGLVRPEDVSRDNVVASTRVADAQLIYASKGNLGKTRGGILGRVIGMIWP